MVAILRGSSKVTAKGQITIPKEIRGEFKVEAADFQTTLGSIDITRKGNPC